jgi:hypothetical protein
MYASARDRNDAVPGVSTPDRRDAVVAVASAPRHP